MTAIFRNLQRQCLPVKSFLSTCQVTKEPSAALLEGLPNHGLFCRIMCTKTDSNEKDKSYIYINNKMSSEAIENSAWACRLANENGYLSWCRNSYLMTGIGVGMLYRGQSAVAELAGYSAMSLAGVNVLWGTYVFIYNLFFLKERVGMSGGFVALQTLSCIIHAVLYVMILIVFAAESDKYFQKHPKEKNESQAN
ncbi:uncharacterized protein LOC111130261 [Crassostrea virginica]